MAHSLCAADVSFQDVKGPGKGNFHINAFLKELQVKADAAFKDDHSERRICGKTAYAVDFYFPEEATIVEVALGLPNAATEFEKDILKAIIAKEHGHAVDRLVFITRPGGERKCKQPGRSALRKWALERHGITIEVHDLPGKPRTRKRRRRVRAA